MPVLSSTTSTGGSSAASWRAGAASSRLAAAVGLGVVIWFMVVLRVSLHFDAAGLRRFATLDADVQHAVAVVGADGIGVDVVGQADDATEVAGEALAQVH